MDRSGRSIVKSFSLYPEDIEILEDIQNNMLGPNSTGSDALRYLINWWRVREK